MGCRHGLSDCTPNHRSPGKTGKTRHIRLRQNTRNLLRNHHRLVSKPPRTHPRQRNHTLHHRSSPRPIRYHRLPHHTRRQNSHPNPGLQQLLPGDPQQRMRNRSQQPALSKQHLPDKLRRLRKKSGRSESKTIPPMQPAQPRRKGMDTAGTQPPRRNLPPQQHNDHRRRNTLRTN